MNPVMADFVQAYGMGGYVLVSQSDGIGSMISRGSTSYSTT